MAENFVSSSFDGASDAGAARGASAMPPARMPARRRAGDRRRPPPTRTPGEGATATAWTTSLTFRLRFEPVTSAYAPPGWASPPGRGRRGTTAGAGSRRAGRVSAIRGGVRDRDESSHRDGPRDGRGGHPEDGRGGDAAFRVAGELLRGGAARRATEGRRARGRGGHEARSRASALAIAGLTAGGDGGWGHVGQIRQSHGEKELRGRCESRGGKERSDGSRGSRAGAGRARSRPRFSSCLVAVAQEHIRRLRSRTSSFVRTPSGWRFSMLRDGEGDRR